MPWREGSCPLEGSGSFPQEEERARRKEGPGIWWAEGFGDEAGHCGSPSASRLLPTLTAKCAGQGVGWAGRAHCGEHFSPQSATLRPRVGGARWRDMSSYLGPHGFLNGLTPQGAQGFGLGKDFTGDLGPNPHFADRAHET